MLEIEIDLASYVGQHFTNVLSSDTPVERHDACVHQRLVDRRDETCPKPRYAEQLAKDLRDWQWDRWLEVGATQCPFTDDELYRTSAGLKQRYPDLRRVLVACDSNDAQRADPTASESLQRKAKQMGFDEVRCKVRSGPDSEPAADVDAEHMARSCKVVVAAHSTYSLMSVVLGHGMVDRGRPAEFYSPKWEGAIAAGLFTHLDQSGVRDLRELWA